jgi:hypothetical protein
MLKAGNLKIDCKIILKWLQFPRAQILKAEYNNEENIIVLTLADEEMPEVENMSNIKTVLPHYITHNDGNGNHVSIRQPIEKCNIYD